MVISHSYVNVYQRVQSQIPSWTPVTYYKNNGKPQFLMGKHMNHPGFWCQLPRDKAGIVEGMRWLAGAPQRGAAQGGDGALGRRWVRTPLEHSNRCKICKTSFRWFRCTTCLVWLFMIFFLFQFSRGGMECASDVSIQRRHICCTVIWIGDAQSTYLFNLFHFRPWQPAKPSTGMSFSNSFQIKQLYGFRNLTELHQNQNILRART